MSFKNFPLHSLIQEGIAAQGFTEPTPVQAAVIPEALKGRDVRACAQTGTGKTAAFVIPILNRLLQEPESPTLVVVPTRELGAQVLKVFNQIGKVMNVKCALLLGGQSFSAQVRDLDRGAEIVVATPGRLNDHLQQKTITLRGVKTLVLDEADRMLDMGFLPAIKQILSHLPHDRQTLLFSATFPPAIEALAARLQKNPAVVSLAPSLPAQTVAQKLYRVPHADKERALMALIKETHMTSAIIFCRTKRRVNRLTNSLEQAGESVIPIHSNKSQSQRTRALHDFSRKKIQFLVATDIASRGLDMKDVSHVINFDVPMNPEDYVHRIGRTGRAKATGDALTLAGPEEEKQIRAIEHLIKKPIPKGTLPHFTPSPPQRHQPHHQQHHHHRRHR